MKTQILEKKKSFLYKSIFSMFYLLLMGSVMKLLKWSMIDVSNSDITMYINNIYYDIVNYVAFIIAMLLLGYVLLKKRNFKTKKSK